MVRRRQSTSKGKESSEGVRNDLSSDFCAEFSEHAAEKQVLNQSRSLAADNCKASSHSTAIDLNVDSFLDEQGHASATAFRQPDRDSTKLAKGRFTNGFGLKTVGGGSTRPSKRNDSVSLNQAEGGAFLSGADGDRSDEEFLDSSAIEYTQPSAKKPLPSTMTMLTRAFKGRKFLLILLIMAIASIVILGPTERRKVVVNKAESAWDKGRKSADGVIDKAGDLWTDMRKGKNAGDGAKAQGSVDISPKPDEDPHKIEIPPMQVGNVKDEASILDAVRQMPKVHGDKGKTTRCQSNQGAILDAHTNARPTVQYAIMIDAGSTGSRVHVYRFNFCKESPELEDETFKMIQGGLSSYKENARGAALSLKPLMDVALEAVPENLRACTPISVKATAGLRLLGAEMSKNILQAVRDMLEKEYPFPIADGTSRNGVEIMEGRDEGVFAWITVNYLLNRIGTDKTSSGKDVQTAAVMDLGGASTQIVFEPIYPSSTQGMHPGEHVYELSNFGGRKYTLYQNSYLGYGLMEARKSINSLGYLSYSLAHPDMVRTGNMPDVIAPDGSASSAPKIKVPSPCFAEGRSKDVPIRTPGQEGETTVTMLGTSGGYDACKRLVEVMMDKDAVCTKPPCSFAGVYQPSLMKAFAESPIVALSYFYDRLTPLGISGTFPLSKLVALTKKVCSPPGEWPKHFGAKGSSKEADLALAELEDRPESCLDLTFLTTLLHLGYELDETRSITVAKKLAGNELGWCLGAQLQVLQDGVICKRV